MAVSFAELQRQVITRSQQEFVKSSATITAEMLKVWLAEAYIEIQKALHPWTKTHTASLVANQIAYARPTDILDRMTLDDRSMVIRSAAGTLSYPPQRDWRYIRE